MRDNSWLYAQWRILRLLIKIKNISLYSPSHSTYKDICYHLNFQSYLSKLAKLTFNKSIQFLISPLCAISIAW